MMRLLKQILDSGGPAIIAVAIVWLSFAAVLHRASAALGAAVGSTADVQQVERRGEPALSVTSRRLTEKDYRSVVAGLRAPEGTNVKAGAAGITVEAKELVDYENWRLMVDEVLLSNKAYRWQVNFLCAGECPELAFQVRLAASEDTVVLTQ